MSIECERWQWRELFASKHGPEDFATRAVLFALSLHMNADGGNAFPSQLLIAERSGLSERAVRTHLANAAKAGWLKIEKRHQKGRAWLVLYYTATIPDELVEHCTNKPWEDDPEWRAPASGAGSQGKRKRPRPANGAGTQHAKTRETGEEEDRRPAPDARVPADDDTTTGISRRDDRHDDRHQVPTNLNPNSSLNSSRNSPIEGAALSRSTTVVGNGVKKAELTGQDRLNAARKLAGASGMETAIKQYRLTEAEIEQVRGP